MEKDKSNKSFVVSVAISLPSNFDKIGAEEVVREALDEHIDILTVEVVSVDEEG